MPSPKKCLFVLGFLYASELHMHMPFWWSVDEKVLPFSISWVLFFDTREPVLFQKPPPSEMWVKKDSV
jgi:hypothetical protein